MWRSGLTSEEVRTRLLTEGPNSLPGDEEQSLLRLILTVLREPMLLLLLAAGVISFLLAELVDAFSMVAAEFVIATMDNSVTAIIALLFLGGIISYFGIRASGVPKTR